MKYVVTGSSGHLGEALVRVLRERKQEVVGLDILESPFTDFIGSVADADFVQKHLTKDCVVLHAATLHKPHVVTHTKAQFIETNVHGTLNILESALAAKAAGVVFTSTTSAFGAALSPAPEEPAAWITEEVRSVPKNIYGVTKVAAEDLCELFYRTRGLPCAVLRTSRFFMEEDDDPRSRAQFECLNLKVNEYLYRRVEISDAAEAHLLAAAKLPELGFARFIISATSPFKRQHLDSLRSKAPEVVRDLIPSHQKLYHRRGWRMNPSLDRVYVNRKAREELGWQPKFDFATVVERLHNHGSAFSDLALAVGTKGYHSESFSDGPYPVELCSTAAEPALTGDFGRV